MPPSSAQYTASLPTETEASILVLLPIVQEAKVVPSPAESKCFSDRVVGAGDSPRPCKGDHTDRKSLLRSLLQGPVEDSYDRRGYRLRPRIRTPAPTLRMA